MSKNKLAKKGSKDFLVINIYIFYLTVSEINIPSLKSIEQF